MNRFDNFMIRRNEYGSCFPDETSVFASLHKGNELLTDDKVFYRFLFSKEGTSRDVPFLKKEMQNTSDLFQLILKEFFCSNQLVSVHYDFVKIDVDYIGICLLNSNGGKLNVYFSSLVLDAYRIFDGWVQDRKYNDFFQYAINRINKKGAVKRIVIAPAKDKTSKVTYIFDNYEYKSPMHKEKFLEFLYGTCGNEIIGMDAVVIIRFIRYFINQNLDKDIRYWYSGKGDHISSDFHIWVSGIHLLICGNDMVDLLEKYCIVDDLYDLIHGKINRMPELRKQNGEKLIRVFHEKKDKIQ